MLPLDSERALADHTLVLEQGLIREMGPAREVDTRGTRVIDATGRFAMPGLADMYTHYWDPADSPLYLAHGITTVRTVCVPFQLALSRVAARGEFASPRMITISPPIDGVDANGRTDMPRGVAMTEPAQAKALAERFASYHQIKAFSLLTAENLRALVRASRVPVTANCPNAMTFEEAVAAGVHCLDQLHNVARGHLRRDASVPAFWDRFDPVPGTRMDMAAIRRLARLLAERQTWNVPTLVFHQRDALAPQEGMGDPALRYVSPSAIKDWESTLIRWSRRARLDDIAAWRKAAAERARAFQEVVAIFHEEGVPLLTGTDSLNPWNVPGATLHAELGNFVAAGMTPYQALRCATAEAGRFLRDGSGTLAVGQRADVLLLADNPLSDLRALDSIEAVAVNGYYLPSAQLESMLEQRAALASAPRRLPATSFGKADERLWIERVVGAEAGRVTFRHTTLADGAWLIEERHASALPRRHVECRTNRLVLDADFTLRSCDYTIETFAGTERGSVARTPDGYAIEATSIDGVRTEHRVATEPLLPSERLTLSLWPRLVQRAGNARVLDIDDGTLAVREITCHGNRFTIKRPTHVTEQLYRYGADGEFLGMQETMPLLWLRELEPAP